MRSEGFPFYTLGGWSCVREAPFLCLQPSATVCNRLQPFATVCNRSWWQKVAVPTGKVAKHEILVVCFVRIPLARLRAVATKCKFRGRRGTL